MTASRPILLVGPETAWAEYVERRLRRRGHIVERAADSREAAARLAARAAAAVIAAGDVRLDEDRAGAVPRIRVAAHPPNDPGGEWLTLPFEIALIVEVLERRLRAGTKLSAPGAAARRPPVRTGAEFFDARRGGVPQGRALCLSGPSGVGKSVFALQFLARGLARGERVLMLSERTPPEVADFGRALRLPLEEPIESGRLLALDLRRYAPAPGAVSPETPLEAFAQLAEILRSNRIRRAALDPCRPWLEGADAAAIHSFLRAFERMDVTTLLTLTPADRAVSGGALERLEAMAATAARLEFDADGARRWRCVRMDGAATDDAGTAVVIQPGIGLRRLTAART